jgi:hypothetical protein
MTLDVPGALTDARVVGETGGWGRGAAMPGVPPRPLPWQANT